MAYREFSSELRASLSILSSFAERSGELHPKKLNNLIFSEYFRKSIVNPHLPERIDVCLPDKHARSRAR